MVSVTWAEALTYRITPSRKEAHGCSYLYSGPSKGWVISARNLRLLLVGGGHANVAVLKTASRWTRQGVEVTLVSDAQHLLYSGMTPEYLGGVYRPEEVRIDLQGWCRKNRIRFTESPARRIDIERRIIYTKDGTELPCDLAVFNLGATNPLQERSGDAVLTKPLHHIERLTAWLRDMEGRPRPQSSLVVVGGGPAGTELMLNVSARIRRSMPPDVMRLALVHSESRLMPQFASGMGQHAERLLRRRGVELRLGSKVRNVEEGTVVLEGGEHLSANLVLWATGTAGQPIFRMAGLPVTEKGFLHVGRDLRCRTVPWLLAAGDCAEVAGLKLDRSGVNAVREGIVLRSNLNRLVRAAQQGENLERAPLKRFHPHLVSPYLVSTGAREAMLALGSRIWLRGPALLWLKHRIDRRWIRQYYLCGV
jgi:NADH dehydrogenase FAD-containing subunit